MIKIPKGVFKYKTMNDDVLIINSEEKEKTYCLGFEFGEVILQWMFNISAHADPTYKLVKIPLKEAQIGKFYFNGELIVNDKVIDSKYLKDHRNYYLKIDEFFLVNCSKLYGSLLNDYGEDIITYDIEYEDGTKKYFLWEVRRI